ncbi:MAG: hypothetical protein A2W91_15110 [Bacteroidetes bacterium GWF2_38_335]|nr:MAG: hypothetical protein A2W91_15110 [Bacteroidetes bacterium GWF2_38_335]OFY78716.1 MAG: hypothetical protein A2281_14230 [Bacteroidetes bacterium RIFOXYA12_FULL_38_20]HBS88477.1 hypothetical protein [Bacteroidales bacterium]
MKPKNTILFLFVFFAFSITAFSQVNAKVNFNSGPEKRTYLDEKNNSIPEARLIDIFKKLDELSLLIPDKNSISQFCVDLKQSAPHFPDISEGSGLYDDKIIQWVYAHPDEFVVLKKQIENR